ncbi:MAG: hypothetical protein ACYSWU_00270 [Planctomycetota bacterium]|jgi:hypothetical protein
MTFAEFHDLGEQFFGDMRSLLDTKGVDYTGGKGGDRLGNFKRVAEALGVSPMVVWGVYYMKHVEAVSTFVKTGHAASEPIYGRMLDLANYALLGAALFKEQRRAEQKLASQ